jgi:cytochrome c oxidase subunit 4
MEKTEQHPEVGHVVDTKILAGVFGALIVLTAVTVGATYVDLGAGNLWAAVGIAAVKAILVAMYFMHLRYDHPFNAIVFAASVIFLVIFIGLALADTLLYKDTVIPDYAPALDR